MNVQKNCIKCKYTEAMLYNKINAFHIVNLRDQILPKHVSWDPNPVLGDSALCKWYLPEKDTWCSKYHGLVKDSACSFCLRNNPYEDSGTCGNQITGETTIGPVAGLVPTVSKILRQGDTPLVINLFAPSHRHNFLDYDEIYHKKLVNIGHSEDAQLEMLIADWKVDIYDQILAQRYNTSSNYPFVFLRDDPIYMIDPITLNVRRDLSSSITKNVTVENTRTVENIQPSGTDTGAKFTLVSERVHISRISIKTILVTEQGSGYKVGDTITFSQEVLTSEFGNASGDLIITLSANNFINNCNRPANDREYYVDVFFRKNKWANLIKCLLKKGNIIIIRFGWNIVKDTVRAGSGHTLALVLYPYLNLDTKEIEQIQVTYFNSWGNQDCPYILTMVNKYIENLLAEYKFKFPEELASKLVRYSTEQNGINFIFTPYNGPNFQKPFLDNDQTCYMLRELFIYQLVSETSLSPPNIFIQSNLDGFRIIQNLFNFPWYTTKLNIFSPNQKFNINRKIGVFYQEVIRPMLEKVSNKSSQEISIDFRMWLGMTYNRYKADHYKKWAEKYNNSLIIKAGQFIRLLARMIPSPIKPILTLTDTTWEDLDDCLKGQ